MTPIEKAQMTLKLLSGNGKLSEEQADRFVDMITVPFPPVRQLGIRGVLTYPLYLYRWIRFKAYNRKWEAETGRQNPFRNGFTIKRISKEEYQQIKKGKF